MEAFLTSTIVTTLAEMGGQNPIAWYHPGRSP